MRGILYLFDKYNITIPLKPRLTANKLESKDIDDEDAEEIYYIILVLSYFYFDSRFKILNKINGEFTKIQLDKIFENNEKKKNMIKIFIKRIKDKQIKSNFLIFGIL